MINNLQYAVIEREVRSVYQYLLRMIPWFPGWSEFPRTARAEKKLAVSRFGAPT